MVTRSEAVTALTAPGTIHELGEAEMYGHQRRVFVNAPPTLRELYAEARSDFPFLVYEGERKSFEETWQEACAIATLLVEDYGIPEERLGEEVGTTVYTQKDISEGVLKGFLTERLAKFEIPRFYLFTYTPLERGPTGKILKQGIRVDALAQLGIK